MKSAFGSMRREVEYLHESDRAFITRDKNAIELNQRGPWSAELTKLAKKHKINSLHISETYREEWPSLDFLLGLPPLRQLHVVLSRPADLTPITKLTTLESLGLMGDVAAQKAVDFSALKKLKRAYIELNPTTMSLMSCAALQHLWIWNDNEPWLNAIDLSRLKKLRELHITAWAKLTTLELVQQPKLELLHLEAIGKLKSVAFHPDAKVRQLKLGGCGAFRIDWDRVGNDLHELELVGPLRFPLEDVLKAPELRRLHTSSVKTFPSLQFLLRLKQLESFDYFTTPPAPKWSDADVAIIKQINVRRA